MAFLDTLLSEVFTTSFCTSENGEEPAIPWHWVPGTAPIVLVLGPNGGGKSFFRRLVRVGLREWFDDMECIHLSMEARTDRYPGAMRSLIYGDEARHSTGELSGSVVQAGIKTCASRNASHVIYWDEPDLGMGEAEAMGAGVVLQKFGEDLPEHTQGVFLTSHSRGLIRMLQPLDPHYVHLGEAEPPSTLAAWLERPIAPRTPDEVKQVSRERYRKIAHILRNRKET
jgi:hypothetical protein